MGRAQVGVCGGEGGERGGDMDLEKCCVCGHVLQYRTGLIA